MLKRVGLGQGHYLYHSLGSFINSRIHRVPVLVFPCRQAASVTNPRPSRDQNSPPKSPRFKHAAKPPLPPDIIHRIEEILSDNRKDESIIQHLRESRDLLLHFSRPEPARQVAEALASTRLPLLSLRFLNIAHILGCKFKDNAYECVAFRLAEKRNWNGVLSAVSLAQQHLGRLSSRLLNWRTRAHVETENYAALEHTVDGFKDNQLVPTRRTFHLILSGHIRNRNLSKAKECLKLMTESGCPPDATTHAVVATHYRRLGADLDVEARALQGLRDLPPITAVAVLNSLINLRLDARDVAGALQLSTLFNQTLMEPIIATMPPNKDLFNAEPINIENIATPPVPLYPNAATYSLFISYQTSRSNLRGALQIFKAMLMTETPITPGVLASVIHALYMGGKGDVAVRMVANMCSPDERPSPLFDRLLSSPTPDDLPWVPSGISPTIRIFNALIKGVLSTHGLGGMENVLQIMYEYNVKPSSATLEILMNHVKRIEGGHARVLSRILRRLSSSDVLPTLRHIHIICSSVLHTEKNLIYGFGWDNVAARFSKTREAHVRPYPEHRISGDAAPFDPTAGIEFPRALRQRELVRPAIESLKSREILSDAPMLALRIRHDSLIRSNLDAAKEIFEVMLERGIHPNEYHFSALMEGFVRADDLEGALDVMRSASRAGVKPNVVMFTILIVAYAHRGNPDKAMQIFEDMISAGVAPDVPSIDAVTSAFFIIGAYRMAKTVLRTLWTYIQPFPADFEYIPLKSLAQAFRSLHTKQRSGDFELRKEDRLALHLKLNRLRRAIRRALRDKGKNHRCFTQLSVDNRKNTRKTRKGSFRKGGRGVQKEHVDSTTRNGRRGDGRT